MRTEKSKQTEIEGERALSVNAAASYLSVRVGTLYAWIYREKIPAFKLQGRWRVSRTTLEAAKGLQHGYTATD
jgi:excisionase family DNA binding protein